MKNGSKIKKIAPVLALILPLALSAVLGAFASLKTANADTQPPSSGNYNTQSYVPNLYNMDITFGVIGANIESVYMFTTLGRTVSNGKGISSYQNIALSGALGGLYYGGYSIEPTNLRLHIDNDMDADTDMLLRAVYHGSPVYLDETAYSSTVGAIGLYSPQNGGGTFNPNTYSFSATFAKPLENSTLSDTISYTIEPVVKNGNFYSQQSVDYVSWEYLEENGFVRNGYILMLDYAFQANINSISPTLGDTSRASIDIAYDAYLYTAEEWDILQFDGLQAFAPYLSNYIPIPADTIGLEVITNGVAEILNTEFIPNFKLWYFLLIGLGVMVTGLALKFFLGG